MLYNVTLISLDFQNRCIIKSLLCQGKKVSITATTGIASSHLGVNATTVMNVLAMQQRGYEVPTS